MANGTNEVLPGGVEPQFRVDVSPAFANYRRGAATSSIDELLAAWRDAASHRSMTAGIVIVLTIGCVLALVFEPRVLPFVVGLGIALLIGSVVRDRRRNVTVFYRFDERALSRFEILGNGLGWLATCHDLSRVTHEDRRASSVIRIPALVTRGGAANLLTNIAVPVIAAGEETLHFLPDALVIREADAKFTAVPYAHLRAEVEEERGHARVTLTWRGSGLVLLAGHVSAARHFVTALRGLAPAPAHPIPPPKPADPPPTEVKMPVTLPVSTDLVRALQASLDHKRRLEELERERASRPEPPPPAVTTKGEWLAEGRSATVHGFAIGPFVYVGNTLSALDRRYDIEPALINPALPVDPSHANTGGAGVNYWPSYSTISASSRRAYLQWLAGGRKDATHIGYVFLFFYGLERRVYEHLRSSAPNLDELFAIAREVTRLVDLYGRDTSFEDYAGALLDFLAAVDPRARELTRDHGYGVSQRLRIELGELSLAGKPIPADLALQWIRAIWTLNTPATRCTDEFELLFHIRYAKQFGEGLVVKPNKTYVELRYQPASAALDELTLPNRRIPDITELTRPFTKLVDLATECTNALDAFSRFLGKNPEGRGSLAAIGLLPEDLVEATPSTDANALASLVRSRLDGDGRAHLVASELLQFVRLAKPEKVSKNEAMLLAQALEKLGYGIEPDVRLGGPVYDTDGHVFVFRRLPDCPSTASDEYATATLCMRLGAAVSGADDDVSQAERDLLQKHISETLQLSPGERQRLSAHLAWLLEEKPGTSGLKKQLAALTGSARHHVGQLLITVATTDGRVDPREMKILEKLYDLIGLDTADLYADIHAALATDDEPVEVVKPPVPKSFAIPPKPAPATTASGIDMERVRLKIAETREVSTLLSGIFTEEEAPVAKPQVAEENTIGTLDAAHSELLRRLAARESWPRDEVERLAGELALMPDGALETINDYAYATAAEPLWEDDDPVAINPRVARELIA